MLGVVLLIAATAPAGAREFPANPKNYLKLLRQLAAGDSLLLAAGRYEKGLPIKGLVGESGKPIVIAGPVAGERAVFSAQRGSNTVSLADSAFVEIRNLELDGQGLPVDGVKAEGRAQWVHDITLENLLIHGYDNDLQTVAISTKCPTWNWVIRDSIIRQAGTGIYLGNSDGSAPFINGVIEHNVISETLGYNMEIKHQKERPAVDLARAVTIIRHNVFSKRSDRGGNKARPNVLVGHGPLTGVGVDDAYWIYGNYFEENAREALFQGEGNLALYNNLFVNTVGDAIHLQPHHDAPRDVWIFGNTILARTTGIDIRGGARGHRQRVEANAVFAGRPIRAEDQRDNVTEPFEAARQFLTDPLPADGPIDLHPKADALVRAARDAAPPDAFADWNLDFDGNVRPSTVRGAYTCAGSNCGWHPTVERKPRAQNASPP